jgi:MoaA/NifB/PqqE/SkfB family radical SAM enzyme
MHLVYALRILQPRSPAVAAHATPPRSVRLSLPDRCDLACVYCRPHRHDGCIEKRLDLDAWMVMVAGLVRAGVRRVRLTGGEPLLHKDVVEVVRALAKLPLDDLAITTNATRLTGLAAPLREAGLQRINVSLDTLDPQRFHRMTRGGNLRAVIDGIEAALEAGFTSMKLNAVAELFARRAAALPGGEGLLFGEYQSALRPYWYDAAKAAGIDERRARKISVYDFRHAAAKRFLDATGNVRGTAFMLGHRNATGSTHRYTKPDKPAADRLVDALARPDRR